MTTLRIIFAITSGFSFFWVYLIGHFRFLSDIVPLHYSSMDHFIWAIYAARRLNVCMRAPKI